MSSRRHPEPIERRGSGLEPSGWLSAWRAEHDFLDHRPLPRNHAVSG